MTRTRNAGLNSGIFQPNLSCLLLPSLADKESPKAAGASHDLARQPSAGAGRSPRPPRPLTGSQPQSGGCPLDLDPPVQGPLQLASRPVTHPAFNVKPGL